MMLARLPQIDLTKLEKLPDALGRVFYAFMLLAVVMALSGAPGLGFALLVFGAAGHVVRAGLEDFAAQRQAEQAEPAIEIRRLAKERPARPARDSARQRRVAR
jgi:hypothetical protein